MARTDNKVVYLHKKKYGDKAGEVFYVGMGSPSRPKTWKSRSPQWFAVVKECGYDIEILATCMSADKALNMEALEIDRYLFSTLTNKKKGASKRRKTNVI